MPLSAPFRVLLVDDDQLDRMAVRRALLSTAPAVHIVEAEDLAGGMREVGAMPVDCLILDYHLPDGIGLDLLMHVRVSSKSLPVIMLTGVGDAQTAVELMKAGATDYIPKSQLSAERLERSLRYAMRIRAADERIRRYTEQLHALTGAALRINSTTPVDAMLRVTAEEARVLVGASHATVTLERNSGFPALSAVSNCPDASADARASNAGALGADAEYNVPLLARDGTPIGGMQLHAQAGHEFTESDRAIINQLAQLASGAIENARLLETAQAATKTRDDMLAIVSHDLRNPVQTIVMASTLLLELAPTDDRRLAARKQVEIVLRAASRANRLIDDLLDATRIDAGTFSVDATPTRVEPLLREAIDLLTPLAAAAQVELTHSLDDDLALVKVDSQRILQVFSNLGGNAIKFTPKGGKVELNAAMCDGEVCLTVRDSGRGIAGEDLAHIFDRFWQAHGRQRHGAGLGLWIAKGIVEAHGGRIEVESEPGSGTLVRFTLPAL